MDTPIRPLIAGNWKMHGLRGQVGEVSALADALRATPLAVDIVICPPATLLDRAVDAADGLFDIGAQDCSSHIVGMNTGEVSARMLREDGVSWVIVGHSERRRQHCETDADVAAKAAAAKEAGLRPIICVGESMEVRKIGNALFFCAQQITGSVPETFTAADFAVGYEPLWAIGASAPAGPNDISEMHANIRQTLVSHIGPEGDKVRIIYGGSVTAANASEILGLPNVDGALVGRESLQFDDFEPIIRAAAAVRV